jgi:hypothetical protein
MSVHVFKNAEKPWENIIKSDAARSTGAHFMARVDQEISTSGKHREMASR